MKINELKEGFFSDVGDVLAPDRYREQDPKKRQAGIQRAFLKDFINDFYVDLRDNIKAGVIGGVAEKPEEKPLPQTQEKSPNTTGSEYAPQGQPGTQFDPNIQTKINEYAIFDRIVESIINEQQKTPMNHWIVKWFNAYMQGVNWQQERSTVEQIATEIANTYKKSIVVPNSLKKSTVHVKKLANLAWQITSEKKGWPGGASNIVQGSGSGRDSITAREIARDPEKTQEFVEKGLNRQERDNLKKALEKAPKQ
jgi:hypothetical protein